MKNQKIGVIGIGNMATAIISGMLRSNIAEAPQISMFDICPAKTEGFIEKGCRLCPSVVELVKESDVVILAVKPQGFPELLEEIKDYLNSEKLIVSIAAGISIDYILEHIGKSVPIVRVLPNTPMLLGCGVSAVTYRTPATREQFEFVSEIFSACGSVYFIDESKFNEIICVHSSSPAYVFLMAKAMSESAERQGIDKATAMRMIAQTFIGAASMIEQTGKSCEQLIDMVASKGGTTEASLRSFSSDDFDRIIDNAMKACTERAIELGGK